MLGLGLGLGLRWPRTLADYVRSIFRLGQDVGWHWQFDDPNDLYRRRNLLTYTEDFSNAAWYKYNSASTSGKVLTLVAENSYIQSRPTGPATLLRPGMTVTLRGVITSSHTQTIRTGIADSEDGNPLVQTVHSLVAGVPTECVQTLLLNSNFGTSVCAQILGIAGSSVAGSTLTINELQLEVGAIPTTYQPVPTTWAQAYLDAVGAERIYAWTDTAGTIPNTAVGEGIGLLLGREYGGATGPSLLANGTTGLTGTATAASYSTTTFAGSVSRAGDASNQSWVTWTGLTTSAVHRIRITNTGATSLDVRNGGVAGTIVASIAAGATSWVHPSTLSASTSITITATTNGTTATFTLSQFNLVPGTHLIQATSTARPLLMARVNLFLASENFTNGAWSTLGTAPTVTENAGTAPNGTLTADRIQLAAADSRLRQNATLNSGASYVLRKWVKSNTGGTQTFRLWGADGAAISSNLTATTSWQLFTFTFTNAGATAGYSNGIRTDSSNTAADLLVWGADLRTADDAAKLIPAYQRVGATAADHDTDGFPHYALADGTDDCWASVGTVDGSATDKLTVVAAVTKNSDAAGALLLELTADSNSNNGAFFISAPQSAAGNFGFKARGTVVSLASGYNAATYAAPTTRVLGLAVDLAASVKTNTVRPYIDAVLDQGEDDGATVNFGGNFANATLYALSRGGSSGRFNGRFYGSTGRFGPMSDSERNNLTRWWQKRIGTA